MNALFAAALILLAINGHGVKSEEKTYGLVIDAGSSGSRIHIFNWEDRDFKSLPPPLTKPISGEQLENNKENGGISDGDEGVAKLDILLMKAKEFLKGKGQDESKWKKFPILLFATAGMRMLDETDRTRIMNDVQKKLSNSGFLFENGWARVLSGEEEGVFGWLSVNYNNFLSKNFYGALDLGGASAQITFLSKEGATILENLYNVQLGSAFDENLYSHSYLQYGLDAARNLMDIEFMRGKNFSSPTTYEHPCYSDGYKHKVERNGITHEFEGKPDFDNCTKLARRIMFKDTPCHTNPLIGDSNTCAINGVYQPPFHDDLKFVAFSSFRRSWRRYKLSSNESTITEFIAKVKEDCVLTHQDLINDEDKYGPLKYSVLNCANNVYMAVLLEYGYNIDRNSKRIVIPDEDYGWTLGCILSESNKLPWNYQEQENHEKQWFVPFVITLVVLLAFIGVSTGIIITLKSRKNSENPSRENIML